MKSASLSLSNKVAVVIGGTSGIGRTLSLGLAEAGADVVPSGRREENIDEVASAIESVGRRTLRLTCDIGDRRSLQRLASSSIERFGKIYILVNCAA
ncbi:MAG: SDR family NAD(P)-dependent oxidoreductase, partial [Terriglobales bacterium]